MTDKMTRYAMLMALAGILVAATLYSCRTATREAAQARPRKAQNAVTGTRPLDRTGQVTGKETQPVHSGGYMHDLDNNRAEAKSEPYKGQNEEQVPEMTAPAPAEKEYRADRRVARKMVVAVGEGADDYALATPSKEMAATAVAQDFSPGYYRDFGRDRFEHKEINPVKLAAEERVSTFSVDVDTASYAFVRKTIESGSLPPKDAVRVEEMVNYFDYDYETTTDFERPFKPNVAVYPTPWNPGTKLLHIGIKGLELGRDDKPSANLVFLIDVSGSMDHPDKLPLVQNSMRLLLDSLEPEDTVGIVVYAGAAGTVLEPTPVKEKRKILAAIERLRAGGSTAGAEGIRQAYLLAEAGYDKDAVNRVILATDGDFNVGITDTNELKSFVEREREKGICLSVLGFGMGNYNDALMQALAQNGNGNAAYIDSLDEARKVLVDEAASTLFTIAKDVKIQVEFNPARVAEYRLIGYETRMLRREDFRNDKVDAGDVGCGHTVTAIYEITPPDSPARLMDDLVFQDKKSEPADSGDWYAVLHMRYKLPDEDKSRPMELYIGKEHEYKRLSDVPGEMRFAASVAAFGQILRGGTYTRDFGFDEVLALAGSARGEDRFGYRSGFMNMVRLAESSPAMAAMPRGVR